MHDWFRRFSCDVAHAAGTPAAFLVSLLLVLLWAASGPTFHFSDTWQLVINTSTTVVTFLMVFVIQATQTRDTQALQMKLDELIRSTRTARNLFVHLEDLNDEEIKALQAEFERVHQRAIHHGEPTGENKPR